MSCLVQKYTIFLNLADNHYQEHCNEPVLTQQRLSPFLSLVVLLSVRPSDFIVSGVKSSR